MQLLQSGDSSFCACHEKVTSTGVQVVVRASDTMDDLRRKVRIAACLGTWQATLTHWKEGGEGLRPQWRKNTVEERLLGVSLTGAHMPNSPVHFSLTAAIP